MAGEFAELMSRAVLRKIAALYSSMRPLRVLDYYANSNGRPKGTVLFSYLSKPVVWRADDRRFLGHSSFWECAELVRIFNCLGYSVDIIPWDDNKFIPRKRYAAIFDIHRNLSLYEGEAKRIFHVTGSDPEFSNSAERQRIYDLESRRFVRVEQRRNFPEEDVEAFHRNLEAADVITFLGNDETAAHFPESVRRKICYVPVTASFLSDLRDPRTACFSREFLWFGGRGAVHKGLDLVLEVFARRRDLILHVVGPYLEEADFVRAYRHELTRCPNILSHGYLYPSSRSFQVLAERVAAFILPSCSESTSTAAVTCMQYGLLPVVSEYCGLGLDASMGITLRSCSLEEIERAVVSICNSSQESIRQMTVLSQEHALRTYSRGAFSECMRKVLAETLS
jgi:hypothetical protein